MGPLLTIAAIGLAAYGIEFGVEEQVLLLDQVEVLVLAGVALVGSLSGIYGRLKAKRPVTLLPKVKP
jgi:hypothetical protein